MRTLSAQKIVDRAPAISSRIRHSISSIPMSATTST
jgi:hypothetical protein